MGDLVVASRHLAWARLALVVMSLSGCGSSPTAPGAGATSPPPTTPTPEPPAAAPEPAAVRAPVVAVACMSQAVWSLDGAGRVVDDDGVARLEALGPIAHLHASGSSALVETRTGEVSFVSGERIERIAALDGSVELAIGSLHDCGRDAEGAVRCRERSLDPSVGPTDVAPIALPGPARALAAGPSMMCAIVERAVHCWGTQVSRGAMRRGDGERFGPVVRAEDADLAYVDDDQGLHVLSGGRLRSPHPDAPVLELGEASELVGGEGHACARAADGRIRCGAIGPADMRLLGGAEAERPTPGTVRDMLGASTALCGGYRYACAVVEGEVQCWGDDTSGVMGAPASVRTTPIEVAGIGRAIDLDVSGSNACAVNAEGEVWCWGSRREAITPWRMEGITGRLGVVLDEYGLGCAWSERDVACWDENRRVRTVPFAARAVVASVDGFVCVLGAEGEPARCSAGFDRISGGSVASAERVTRRIVDADRLRAFGTRLCAPASSPEAIPGCYEAGHVALDEGSPSFHRTEAPELIDAVAWDATRVSRCIAYDAAVSCSGRNMPREPIASRATDVSVGRYACVVQREGGAACFDASGPVRVPGLDRAIEVGVGDAHACLRDEDGAVRCWGDGREGRLGVALEPPAQPIVLVRP